MRIIFISLMASMVLSWAVAAEPVQVMVQGTFHFRGGDTGNPAVDIFWVDAQIIEMLRSKP